MKQPKRTLGLILFALYLLVCMLYVGFVDASDRTKTGAQGKDHDPSSQPQPTLLLSDNSWQDLNYYQLLGLDEHGQENMDDITIRKAYRAQAKRFHPDKMATQNLTKEESQTINSRFAKIAEAYQVLSDASKRAEYDRYLQYERRIMNDSQSSQPAAQQHGTDEAASLFHSWFPSDDEPFDPFAMFDMVFGSDKSAFSDFDPSSLFAGMNYGHHHPIRTTQEQFEFVNDFGQVVIRVQQTEDYATADESPRRRVIIQDFVEDWDPYERQWVLVPLQPQPVVVEEQQQQQEGHGASGSTASTELQWLWPGTIMTPGMFLENPPYQAGLTSSCELVVVARTDVDDEDVTVQWSSSGISLSGRRQHDCGLWLEGRRLVVATLTMPPQVIWFSKNDSEDDAEDEMMLMDSHAARLDDDGCLSVYRLEEPDEFWKELMLRTESLPPIQRGLAKIGGLSLEMSTNRKPIRTVCIFSTSPVGCFRIGRLLFRLAKKLHRLVDWLLELVPL